MLVAKITGPKQFEVFEKDAPTPDGSRVIIKIAYCGICGSDLHLWVNGTGFGGVPDFIPGHEIAGVVEDAGSRNDLNPGDHVTVIPFNPCGNCVMCAKGFPALCMGFLSGDPDCMAPGVNAPGAYAEYFAARPDMVRKLPEEMSLEEGSMIEPAAVGLHAVNAAHISLGDSVLINGGGIIGLMCASWARLNGAGYIVLAEANDLRGQNALKMANVDAYFDVKDPDFLSKILDASCGGFDCALETSATDAGINSAFQALRPHGRFVMVGVNERPSSIMTILAQIKELEQTSIMGFTIGDFETVMGFMRCNRLDSRKYISGTCPLDGVQETFKKLGSGVSQDVKIIIQP